MIPMKMTTCGMDVKGTTVENSDEPFFHIRELLGDPGSRVQACEACRHTVLDAQGSGEGQRSVENV